MSTIRCSDAQSGLCEIGRLVAFSQQSQKERFGTNRMTPLIQKEHPDLLCCLCTRTGAFISSRRLYYEVDLKAFSP